MFCVWKSRLDWMRYGCGRVAGGYENDEQDGGYFRLVMVISAVERVGRKMDGRVFGWRLLVGRAWIYHDGVYACQSL